jgi:acetyl-CoA carboxylase carboxyl transferase subunit beta
MNWLTNFVRPKLRKLVRKTEVPEDLWHQCPNCDQMIFHRELEKSLHVCGSCGHHMQLSPKLRLEMLFDGGSYKLIELPKPVIDPLKFRDRRRYTERLKEAQARNGDADAILVGGLPVVVATFDFTFMGGSMGLAVGDALVTASRLAVLQRAAMLVVPASGGARMQEGILSLMQMPRTTIAVDHVKEAGLPYLVVLTNPTTGGVSASFAMLGDIMLAEPGAVIGFAGARVIEDTIHETLPEGFQRSEYLYEHGMVDMVVHRQQLRDTIVRILRLLTQPGPGGTVTPLPPKKLDIPEAPLPGETDIGGSASPPPERT